MAATDSKPVPTKNAAWRVYFTIFDNTGAIVTSWTSPAGSISKDGAGFAATTNAPVEIGTSGIGYVDLTATEMNADGVCLKLSVGNANAKPTPLFVAPREAGDIPVDLETVLGASMTVGPIPALGIIDQGVAQAAASTTLQIRAAAAFADNELVGATVVITGGSAGVGQRRIINSNVGATDTLTVDAWTTTPTGTITYLIVGTPPASSGSPIPAVLTTTGIDAILTRQMTESYASDGSAPTLTQALLLIQQILSEAAVSGVTMTVKKLDGSTTAATFTLNDGSNPTSITRAS